MNEILQCYLYVYLLTTTPEASAHPIVLCCQNINIMEFNDLLHSSDIKEQRQKILQIEAFRVVQPLNIISLLPDTWILDHKLQCVLKWHTVSSCTPPNYTSTCHTRHQGSHFTKSWICCSVIQMKTVILMNVLILPREKFYWDAIKP